VKPGTGQGGAGKRVIGLENAAGIGRGFRVQVSWDKGRGMEGDWIQGITRGTVEGRG